MYYAYQTETSTNNIEEEVFFYDPVYIIIVVLYEK